MISIKLNPQEKKMFGLFQFLSKLAIFSVPVYFILEFGVSLYAVQLRVAEHMHWVFTSWGFPIVREGVLFRITGDNPFVFIIGEDCIAWKSMLFLFALIFAVPKKSMNRRVIGLAIGLPIIWLGNLFRIFGVVWVHQVYGTETALFLHDIGWQLGLVALVLILWVSWLWLDKKVNRFLKYPKHI